MSRSPLFRPDPDEALGLWLDDPRTEGTTGLRSTRFEFSSRGDRVPGHLLLPPRPSGPRPLVLVSQGNESRRQEPALPEACRIWAGEGAAVAAVDLPLQGARTNAKLSQKLGRAFEEGAAGPLDATLWTEFTRQAVLDLRRALDALGGLDEVASGRVAYVGSRLGAAVGAIFCAADPRVCCAVLALGGGGSVPRDADPAAHVRGFAPRPLLLVNARCDERLPRERAEALHAAAGEPTQALWLERCGSELPAESLDPILGFVRLHLPLSSGELARPREAAPGPQQPSTPAQRRAPR